MSKIMIMSLGGSPEPLIKSITIYRPDKIIFLASHDSVSLAGDILKKMDFKPAPIYEITENPNIMFECYKKARRCAELVKTMDTPAENVIVDYTGGTKVMTAALILATIGQPFQFNYVGGEQRNKNGLGVVMDGHEKMFAEMNPWSIFAEEERRQIVTLFNRRRFSAVVQIIDDCLTRELPFEIKGYFSFVRPLAEGFLFWEQFNHMVANRKLKEGLGLLGSYIKAYPDSGLVDFLNEVQKCEAFLHKLIEDTGELKSYHFILVKDLLNNARRRMADKRYDDAAARIYRALELYGQIVFQEVTGFANNNVKPEIIPDQIRDEFVRKYEDTKKKTCKLPMTATFQFLKEKGHDAGHRFFEYEKDIKKIQNNRNDSILAHGINPVSEKACISIFKTVSSFVGIDQFFDFPMLS